MSSTISNTDDVIDSRDVIARIEELSADQTPEGEAELIALANLASEAADYSEDWEYGATLVRDSYFKEYAMDLAEEIGAVNPDAGWPANCIDWEQAARELRMDYTSVDFDGVTYWVR